MCWLKSLLTDTPNALSRIPSVYTRLDNELDTQCLSGQWTDLVADDADLNPLFNVAEAEAAIGVGRAKQRYFAWKLRTSSSRETTGADDCARVLVAVTDGRTDVVAVPAVTDGRVDDARVDDGRMDDGRVDEDFLLGAYGSVNLDRRGRELPFVLPSTLRRMSWADFS